MKAQIKGIESKALPFTSAPLELGIKSSGVNKLETQKIFSSKSRWKLPSTWSLLQGIKVVNFIDERLLPFWIYYMKVVSGTFFFECFSEGMFFKGGVGEGCK